MRLLPKTYEFLAHKLGAIVFRGMNKVGDNTYPNLVALLTGLEAYRQVPHPGPTGDTFDGTPLVWKDFHEAGYRTFFAEDFPRFGLFNYLARGFERPPTDLYLRPFWLAVEDSFLLRSSSSLCFGNVVKHRLQMEYLRSFLVQSRNMSLPYFAFSFLVEISHEYMQQVAAADDDFVSFLSELLTDGHLDNTFLFFFSDHGHRFDSIRETFVGRIEERLPFFAVRPPSKSDWLNSEVDMDPTKSFKSNSGRLTSPYDTYETLRDILSLGWNGSQTDKRVSDFGISLFRAIPANRTCEQAGVPSQYCSCDSETPLDLSDPVVAKSALALVGKVNQLLVDGLGEHSKRCARLRMHRIHDARELTASQAPPSAKSGPNMDVAPSSSTPNMAATTAIDTASSANATSGVRRLRVTVEVYPSGAMFDGTLLVSGDMGIRVLEDISRINRYGNQSACIEHEILRRYCYCALTT
uniref:Sulfatase n=1 Tax=Ixodes ricinus TaxID=34613 RepID=V5GWQ5_IXORI